MKEIDTIDPYWEKPEDLIGYYEDLSHEYSYVVSEYNNLENAYCELQEECDRLYEKIDTLETMSNRPRANFSFISSILFVIVLVLWYALQVEKGK